MIRFRIEMNNEEDLSEWEADNHIDDHDHNADDRDEKVDDDDLTEWEADVHLGRKSFVCSIQLAGIPAECRIQHIMII